MLAQGIQDSEEAAHAYLEKVVDGTTSRDVLDVFIKEAPKAIKYIEENSPLRFHSMTKFLIIVKNFRVLLRVAEH